MPTPPARPRRSAPLDAALRRVGDRWSLLLVEALLPGPRRFGELLEGLDGLAPNILSSAPQGAGGRGDPGRPAVLAAALPGRLRAHRARRRAGRRAAPARAVGRPAVRARPARRRCTTPPAAPRSRPAGGAPPAPAIVADDEAPDLDYV